MKDEDRCRDGDDGDQVDVNAGFNRPQDPDGKVPGHKAEGGSPEPQKQYVQQIDRVYKTPRLKAEVKQKQGGDHK